MKRFFRLPGGAHSSRFWGISGRIDPGASKGEIGRGGTGGRAWGKHSQEHILNRGRPPPAGVPLWGAAFGVPRAPLGPGACSEGAPKVTQRHQPPITRPCPPPGVCLMEPAGGADASSLPGCSQLLPFTQILQILPKAPSATPLPHSAPCSGLIFIFWVGGC